LIFDGWIENFRAIHYEKDSPMRAVDLAMEELLKIDPKKGGRRDAL